MLRWFYRIAGGRPVVEIVLDLPAFGRPGVSTFPAQPLAVDVAIASLLYASKIRWVALSEPAIIGEMLQAVMEEALEDWGKEEVSSTESRLLDD